LPDVKRRRQLIPSAGASTCRLRELGMGMALGATTRTIMGLVVALRTE